MLLELVLAQVGPVEPEDIDDGEFHIRVVGGDLVDCISLGKADAQHHGGSPADHAPHRLLALGFVGDLELHHLDAGLVHELLDAVPDALVEGFVELAAHVEDDGGLELGSLRYSGNGGQRGPSDQMFQTHDALPFVEFFEGHVTRLGRTGKRGFHLMPLSVRIMRTVRPRVC